VAQALGDQTLALDQITALNTTTSNLIESTAVLPRQRIGPEVATGLAQPTATPGSGRYPGDEVTAVRTTRPFVRLSLIVAAAALALGAAACGSTSSTPNPADPSTLTVLAGSEVKDLQPILDDLRRATGVALSLTYTGSLDGAEQIDGGAAVDAAWFSLGNYLRLLPNSSKRIVASNKIMLSPVVIGVKQSVASRFGWANNPNVTWKDIQARAADGSFHFAMTNPAASNTGLSALIGVATALSGSSDAIDTGTIDTAALTAFFKGQTLTAGSSGFLADDFVRQQDSIDGIVNYESVLMSLNSGGKLHEPLTLIYPKEGIVTADYPLMLLNKRKQAAYDKAVAWLLDPAQQKRIMADVNRRPAIPGVALDSKFPSQTLVSLSFPSRLETINALISSYLNIVRKPASAVFVLDLSGSMQGDRLAQLKHALTQLTGLDQTLTGQFSAFRAREQITFITFSTDVEDVRSFTIDDTNTNGPDMTAIRDYIDGLQADGSTAIYSALDRAYSAVDQQIAADPNRLYSIVLMTDGENNAGVNASGFQDTYHGLPAATQAVHVYPILFGNGAVSEMKGIASLTGGTVFDAQTTSLDTIFKQIRGFQ
jgi:Ca-activated chloride channel homolog